MCGIVGFKYFNELQNQLYEKKITSMNEKICHRGPDQFGTYIDNVSAIGMRRLSIIDLKSGKQPIFNEDNTLAIVYNGEVYNYPELRDELIKKGHIFSTNTDTEVILHLYEEYGDNCVNYLNGMFAFCIYHLETKDMFIARDRLGQKPLYYLHDDDKFVFASELKSIIEVFKDNKELSKRALNQYLSLTYIPAPLTIFEGIFKLKPGHTLNIIGSNIIINKYWDIEYSDNELIRDYDACSEELSNILNDAVEKRLVSDVPVGTFLSGGIDSSLITTLAHEKSNSSFDTFTIGFDQKEYDESNKAKIVAESLDVRSNVRVLDYDNLVKILDKIIDSFDEPFADSSALATYFVSQFAREHSTVVLTGDAGDELFAGYSKYLINYYNDKYTKIPKIFRDYLIEPLVNLFPDNTSLIRKVKKVIRNSSKSEYEKRIELMKLGFSNTNDILNDAYIDNNAMDFVKVYYDSIKADDLTKALYTDLKVVLEGDMLTKVDRMSMLASIEARTPMLDYRFVEFAFKVPSEFKIRGKKQKYILKETFRDKLPEEIFDKTKQGFGVPVGDWFRKELKDELLKVTNKDFIEKQGIFNYDGIKSVIDEHIKYKENNSFKLWSLFVFQKWYIKYFMED